MTTGYAKKRFNQVKIDYNSRHTFVTGQCKSIAEVELTRRARLPFDETLLDRGKQVVTERAEMQVVFDFFPRF